MNLIQQLGKSRHLMLHQKIPKTFRISTDFIKGFLPFSKVGGPQNDGRPKSGETGPENTMAIVGINSSDFWGFLIHNFSPFRRGKAGAKKRTSRKASNITSLSSCKAWGFSAQKSTCDPKGKGTNKYPIGSMGLVYLYI